MVKADTLHIVINLFSERLTVTSHSTGSCVKLKTTFNLSRELLAPPEPPSQRRGRFSVALAFHLSANCYQGMQTKASSHLIFHHSPKLPPAEMDPPWWYTAFLIHPWPNGQSNLTLIYWRRSVRSRRKLPSPRLLLLCCSPPLPSCARACTSPFTW